MARPTRRVMTKTGGRGGTGWQSWREVVGREQALAPEGGPSASGKCVSDSECYFDRPASRRGEVEVGWEVGAGDSEKKRARGRLTMAR